MRIDNISYITQPSVIKNKNTNINVTQPNFGANIPAKALDNFNLFLKEYRKYKLSNSVYAVDYLFSLWKFMHKEGMRNLNQSELQLVEGLQNGLPTLEHLEMPQVQALVDLASKNSLTIPIVRGCKHTCAHCYLAATPPIKRISFEDFVDAIHKVHAKHIIILPNNKNILMSAQQACRKETYKSGFLQFVLLKYS